MYINDMGEKIVYDNWGFSPSSKFFDLAQFGITNPNPRYYISYYPIIGTRRCYYVFEYVISGAGYIEMNGEKIRVEAGDFYFYHKNAKLTYYSDPDDPYKKVWVNVRGTLVDSLVDSFGLGMFIHKKMNCEDIFRELHSLLEPAGNSPEPETMRRAARIIYRLIDMAANEKQLFGTTTRASSAERIRGFLDAHLMRGVTLREVAAANYISEMHAIRVFSEEYGMTPMKYHRERRLAEAKELLASGSMTIKEVSDAFGYSDRRHFTSVFRREYGMTPAEYLRSLGRDK